MATIGGPDNIVTLGLKYCIDGKSKNCYDGSGLNLTNLAKHIGVSGSNNGGVLNNGASGSLSNGYFTFDGVNDHISSNGFRLSTAQLTAGYTFELWGLWTNSEAGGEHQHGSHSGNSPGGRMYLGWYQDQMMVGAGSGYNQVQVGGSENNKWYYMSQTHDGSGNIAGYLNAEEIVTATGRSFGNALLDAGNLQITWGSYTSGNNSPPGYAYTNGYLACGRWYNRALSAAEILHNFNAQRERFGV